MRDNATVDMTNGIKTLPYSVKDRGSIFFFPSFVHHQVTPVTRGTRKSFVGWCVGNQYV
jgi:predicted 2-oxoglutarate/Fe(II)-dependent dioxygenase YbiX